MAGESSENGLSNKNANEEYHYMCNFIPGKVIEHCLFSWTIENFQRVAEDGDKYITSHSFALDSICTMWNLRFYPHKKEDVLTHMKFCLYRYEKDGGPEFLKVSYRFGLKNEDDNIWFAGKEHFTFKPGTIDSVLTDENTYQDNRHILNNNSVTVVCEMYISVQKNKSELSVKDPSVEFRDLMRLSYNMTQLRKTGNLSDVIISINKNIFRLHKCILSARSTYFANDVNVEYVIDSTSTDNDHIDIIINYIYSGNFTYSIQNNIINFGLYECSKKYEVNGLTQLLAPKYINLKSIIVEETFNFTWSTENFNDLPLRRGEYLISSPFSGLSPKKPIWHLEIYPKGTVSHPNFISVVIRSSQTIEAVRIYTTLSLLNENDEVVFEQHGEIPLLSKTTFGFMEFIRTDLLTEENEYLNKGKLTIKCSTSLFISECYYEGSSMCLEVNYQEFPCLKRLSADMEMLLESESFSDRSLFAAGKRFKVHQAILSTRYPAFLSNLNIPTEDIGIPDIDLITLEEIIFYAYTATLKEVNMQSFAKLYKVALAYKLTPLAKRCFLEASRRL